MSNEVINCRWTNRRRDDRSAVDPAAASGRHASTGTRPRQRFGRQLISPFIIAVMHCSLVCSGFSRSLTALTSTTSTKHFLVCVVPRIFWCVSGCYALLISTCKIHSQLSRFLLSRTIGRFVFMNRLLLFSYCPITDISFCDALR